MTVEIGILVAVVGCLIGVAGWFATRDKRIMHDSQWKGEVNAKLDVLLQTKTELAALDTKLATILERVNRESKELGERLVTVEQSTKSAHHRLDEIQKEMQEK